VQGLYLNFSITNIPFNIFSAMNIVWLASWYPNRTNITNGDFIERHAKAVAPFLNSLTIISAVKDETLAYNAIEIVEKQEGNITTYIIYYGRSRWGGVMEKFISLKKYVSLQQALFEKIVNEKGKPDIIHVHVAMKAGLVAKKIKQQYNIPYIITEHWTAYYKEAKPNIYEMGNYFVSQTKSVLKNAALLLTVSNDLGKRINKYLLQVKFQIVPNVVDTDLFHPVEKKKYNKIKLVHVSNMTHQKNMEAIIEGLSIWKSKGGEFIMHVFGEAPKEIIEKVTQARLQENIIFNGEVLQPQLCDKVKQSDALILYSRYETFGCVIIEANACGIPVIVSDLPVFYELVQEDKNGVFVESDKPAALVTALEKFVHEKDNFNSKEIAANTSKRFSYPVVGKQIKDVYDEILKR
jgi:glycosyltransferase involved in cell wall biosynthesis